MSADDMVALNDASATSTDRSGNDTDTEDSDIEACIMPMLFCDNSGRGQINCIVGYYFKQQNW